MKLREKGVMLMLHCKIHCQNADSFSAPAATTMEVTEDTEAAAAKQVFLVSRYVEAKMAALCDCHRGCRGCCSICGHRFFFTLKGSSIYIFVPRG